MSNVEREQETIDHLPTNCETVKRKLSMIKFQTKFVFMETYFYHFHSAITHSQLAEIIRVVRAIWNWRCVHLNKTKTPTCYSSTLTTSKEDSKT